MLCVLPINPTNKVERFYFVGGKTHNIVAIQLVLQQGCKTSCTVFFTRFTVPLNLTGMNKVNRYKSKESRKRFWA